MEIEPQPLPAETPMPSMTIVAPTAPAKPELAAAQADSLGKFCESILADISEDGKQLNDVIQNFMEMVMNEGDASGSSKEALVTLLKTKADQTDKKIKVMDLLMRAYLKESNTFPKYLAATQHNHFEGSKRSLIQNIKENK